MTITSRGVKTKTATLRADGTVVVKLAKFKKRGVRTLTVTYSGDTYVEAATTTSRSGSRSPRNAEATLADLRELAEWLVELARMALRIGRTAACWAIRAN